MHEHDHDNDHAHRVPDHRDQQGRRQSPDLAPGVASGSNSALRAAFGSTVDRSGEDLGAGPLDPAIAADIRAAQGGGATLGEDVRADMEGHFGTDLGAVRVHTGPKADQLSRSVQAEAFTTGADIFFKSGSYAPSSTAGRRLLGHELTHVVQQASGTGGDADRVSHPDDTHEREAAAVGDEIAATPVSTGPVDREAMGEEEEDLQL